MEPKTFKVTLSSYEELVQFETVCFRENKRIAFLAPRPRVFPCEMDILKETRTRFLPPDYFYSEVTTTYQVLYVTKL